MNSVAEQWLGMESGILERKWGGDKGVTEKQNQATKQQHRIDYLDRRCVVGGTTSGGPAVGAGVCFLVQGCFGVTRAEY